jgi:hypothetical protein
VGDRGFVATSTDGSFWTQRYVWPWTNSNFRAAAFADSRFLIAGKNGLMLQSGDVSKHILGLPSLVASNGTGAPALRFKVRSSQDSEEQFATANEIDSFAWKSLTNLPNINQVRILDFPITNTAQFFKISPSPVAE